MNSVDISGLAKYFGKYERKLFSTLRNSCDVMKDMTLVSGIKDSYNLTKLTVDDDLLPYNQEFEPSKNSLKYSGRTLKVNLVKKDILINPLDYRNTWLGEMMSDGVNPREIPFVEYVANEVVKSIAAGINNKAYFSSLSKGGLFDGLSTHIDTAIKDETVKAGTGLTPVATGAITDNNAVSKFELMTQSMPEAFFNAGFNLYCSKTLFNKYNTDYRERYKKNYESNEQGVYTVDGTDGKVRLVPCTWLSGSQRIIATPKENLLCGIDGLGDTDKMDTMIEFSAVKWRWLFALGFQIRDLDAIRVNDQA